MEYNDDSFFVRSIYFCSGGDPHERLKSNLKAKVDEAKWVELYTPKNVPFDQPKNERISGKVINHYWDDVVKAYQI